MRHTHNPRRRPQPSFSGYAPETSYLQNTPKPLILVNTPKPPIPADAPTLSMEVDQDTGKVTLISESPDSTTERVTLPKVTGHKEYDTASRKSQIVGFTDTGFQGKVSVV